MSPPAPPPASPRKLWKISLGGPGEGVRVPNTCYCTRESKPHNKGMFNRPRCSRLGPPAPPPAGPLRKMGRIGPGGPGEGVRVPLDVPVHRGGWKHSRDKLKKK